MQNDIALVGIIVVCVGFLYFAYLMISMAIKDIRNTHTPSFNKGDRIYSRLTGEEGIVVTEFSRDVFDGVVIRFKNNPYELVTMREFELTNAPAHSEHFDH